MATRQQNIVRVMCWIADELEARGLAYAGILRQLAREVATLRTDEPEAGRCPCGGVVVQPRTGRPRKHCLKCSPPRKSRKV